MIKLSELKVIEDTFFRSNLIYYKPSIYHLIEKNFREENDFSDATVIKLKNIIYGNKDMAYNSVLKEDIKTLIPILDESPKEFDDELWRNMLPKIRDSVKLTLGLDFKTRSIFFQESFPEGMMSFELKGASSITIFEGNKDAGIYFLNKRISSFFTPILLIHEQLHTCLSQNKSKDQMYIEWFEEGICQWYSMKIYFDLTKNIDVLKLYRERCYLYSKIKDEQNFTKRYFEYMKIMSRLFLKGGDRLIGKLLVEYMSDKRTEINSYLDLEKIPIEYLPKNDIENFLANFTFFIEPEKVSPVEYLILKEILTPKLINEVAKAVNVPPPLLNKAIFSLQIRGMLIIKEDKIEINWRKKDLFDKALIKPFWPL